MKGYELGLNKTAGDFEKTAMGVDLSKFPTKEIAKGLDVALRGTALATLSAIGFKTLYNRIKSSTRHKAVIDDLMTNDPIIREADPEEMAQIYATIYKLAPGLALEKPAVREIMQNYAKMGRLDMQTVKMLVEANDKMGSNPSSGMRDVGQLAATASQLLSFS